MAQLAIIGHKTRGKEVIKILEMLGGKSYTTLPYQGDDIDRYYYINRVDNYINAEPVYRILVSRFRVFTLEQFLEKFPYKVGDRVLLKGVVKTIKQVCWDNTENEVIYKLETNVHGFSEEYYVHHYDLQPYKMEVNKEFYNKYCVNCGSQRCTAEGEWLEECRHYKEETMEEIKIDIPKGYEFTRVDNDNQQVVFTKIPSKYPKTYVECAKLLDCFSAAHIDGYKGELLDKFQELLICRDAYWKIAGEKMGLGKPWKPNWDDESEDKYTIVVHDNQHCYANCKGACSFLTFPTAEMRDAFYENFKDLIEQCKELL